ncbi:MAG: hypothetical protein M3176_14405 [Chloroflexota bacterium]|nr:hypothetical protein [Chloroflexota bacterium]
MGEMKPLTRWEAEGEQEVIAQLQLLWRFYYEPRAATMELFPGEHSGLMVDVAHARRIVATALGTSDPLYVLLDTALRLNALPALRGALQTFVGQSSPLHGLSPLPCSGIVCPDPFEQSGYPAMILQRDTGQGTAPGDPRNGT